MSQDLCLSVPKVHKFVWYYFVIIAKLDNCLDFNNHHIENILRAKSVLLVKSVITTQPDHWSIKYFVFFILILSNLPVQSFFCSLSPLHGFFP